MAAEAGQHKSRGKALWIIVVIVLLIAAGVYGWNLTVGSAMASTAQPTYTVKEGPLLISVVQSGTIKSLEQVSLKCEVEGSATIIYLIPEGTEVKEGDLLVELDASRLQDDLIAQQISVDNAEASFITARENLAVAKNQAASDISKAELDYQFAEEDVNQYVKGSHPQELREAEANITLTREEKERAEETLTSSEKLYAKKYISQTELEADRLAKKRAELNYELAVASLDLLKEYTSPRKLAELHSNVDQMQMALERVKLQSNADVVQAEANLKAKQRELEQQKTKLAKYERQIERTKIYAPRSGLVVYATSVQMGGRRMRNEPLEEGQSIRERQELIYLPSADSMMAEVQIHESSLEKVRIGLPVRITIDALPGESYRGRVAKIAPLPDAQSAWLNPDLKVYPCEIHLEGTHPELRTGMSCQAEIIVEQYPEAIYVPVQAVLRLGNVPNVFVRKGDKFEATPIDIGLDNNSMVYVKSGLEVGQEVLLTPPLDSTVSHEEPQLEDMSDVSVQTAPPTMNGSGAAGPTGMGMPNGGAGGQMGEMGQPGQGAMGQPNGQGGPQMGGGAPGQEDMRQRFQNMSEEERAAMRERFRNMTPEERERMRQQFGGQGGPRGGGPGGDGASERRGRGERPSGGGPGGENGAGGGQSGGEQPRPGGPGNQNGNGGGGE